MATSAASSLHPEGDISELLDDVLAEGLGIEEIETRITRVGSHIRDLKERQKDVKDDSSKVEAIKQEIDQYVKLLVALKNELPLGHPLRPEERKKAIEKDRENRHKKPAFRPLSSEEVATHRVQRKIHNVFATLAGNTDDDDMEDDKVDESNEVEEVKLDNSPTSGRLDSGFKLDPSKFNTAKTGLDFSSGTIIATEKWDGTTLQATKHGIFKRRDLIARGDEKKFGASEQERYSLIQVDIEHPSYKNLRKAIGTHKEAFKMLPEGVTIYFEGCGPRIQTRFKEALSTPGLIRVFDSSLNGEYLPFTKTAQLAAQFGLPIVHSFIFSTSANPKSPQDLVDFIVNAQTYSTKYTGAETELSTPVEVEGYVFRDAADPTRIAKLRIIDLKHLGVL